MKFSQPVYKIIYQSQINYLLRNCNYHTHKLLNIKFKIPPSGTITLRTASGRIKLKTNQTCYIGHLLFWEGYKNFEYSSIFEELVKQCETFLDIGANIGYYSLLAVRSNPNISVVAFEPSHGAKHFLKANVELNGNDEAIKIIEEAVSDNSGVIAFYEVENLKYPYLEYNLAGENNTGTKTTSRNFVKTEVKTNTLDNYINQENLSNIDLIKIDTEGSEFDILKAGKNALRKFQPIVISETLFNTTEEKLNSLFQELDYKFYNHVGNGLLQVDTIKRTSDNGVRNCFFVPPSKENLISKFVVNA